jgi:hypothetical protein
MSATAAVVAQAEATNTRRGPTRSASRERSTSEAAKATCHAKASAPASDPDIPHSLWRNGSAPA